MERSSLYPKRFVIVSHIYATGPSFHLVEYLRSRADEVVFIGHPFGYVQDTRSFLRVYRKGELVKNTFFYKWKGPDLLFFLKDFLLTLWWALPRSKGAVFIGVNSFNTLTGYVIKRIVGIQTLIFYTIDYIPQRFPNKTLNRIYHWMDRASVRVSDRVWNLSPVMVSEREKRGVLPQYRSKQITVPVGTVVNTQGSDLSQKNPTTIVFMGHLRSGQGVETLLEAMPIILQQVAGARLLIIGGGPLQKTLENMASVLGIKNQVTFTGFVEKFSDMLAFLHTATVAVAPYVNDSSSYTQYTDPGKPKDYLSCGLPVVITKVPQVALEIQERQCGFAVHDTKEEIAKAITILLQDDALREKFSANARTMAMEYSWENIFNKAFDQT